MAQSYDTDTYHTIVDHTQAGHPNVVVTNTETFMGKNYPLTGAKPVVPWSAINGDSDHTTPSSDGRVHYREAKMDHTDLLNAALTVTTTATQGVDTYVHRLGSWNGGPKIKPLEIAPAGSGNFESILDLFSLNGQAFDLDRLRYMSNKLWRKWKEDVQDGDGWYTKFGYQPTGTMSFEQYLSNINNGHPMFGIVRVMVPVNATSGKGDVQYDPDYMSGCVDGKEFSSPGGSACTVTWTASVPGKTNTLNSYYGVSDKTCAKTIEVYGMLLYDYVDEGSYTPDNFETGQDYVDNATQGTNNQILPRSSSKSVYIKVTEAILVNPVNDLLTGDYKTAGRDFRMDSLETGRAYMISESGQGGSKTAMDAAKVSDAYVWEYWMREAATKSSSSRAAIISSLASEYDVINESFTVTTGERSKFNGGEWSGMETKDQYHAYFPSGYERGWMIAFDALDLQPQEWGKMPNKGTTLVGGKNINIAFPAKKDPGKTDYASFKVPTETIDMDFYNGSIPGNTSTATVVDTDPPGNPIPNTFLTTWEDLPALSFAGGVLDIHAHANISGMQYTPDSAEIETKKDKYAPFQYINGALLVGNGVFLEDGGTSDFSMIAISYNANTFDQLKTGTPSSLLLRRYWQELK